MISLLSRESQDATGSPTVGNVLVIDDSPDMLIAISETLSLAGYRILAADSGKRGLELAAEHCPQLVLCDLLMDDMDGFEVLAKLREVPALATTPVIMVSAHADKDNVRRGMEMGADDFLGKPFTAAELIAAVQCRLSKQAELARQSDRRLDQLRGHLSMAIPHEFRTPLQGIVGLADMIIDRYMSMSGDEVLETARCIHQSAKRLHRVIENFLVYSQIEIMEHDGAPLPANDGAKPVPLHDVIAVTACCVATRYGRIADLQLKIGTALVRIPAEQWEKIAEELLDNAFKFSQVGQHVTVELLTIGGRVQCVFMDQGRGIKPEHLSEIGPHRQFERETFEQQGAGLGLIIAKRLTEILGGEFEIQSVPQQGTRVRIAFPLADF